MRSKRLFSALFLFSLPGLAATFGTVVTRPEGFGDIVLDEARGRLYLVNTVSGSIGVYSTGAGLRPPAPVAPNEIKVGKQPISAALSRSGRYLYVACYESSSLDVVDLDKPVPEVVAVPLSARPQGVAVGFDERVLVSTIGTAQGEATLIVYDPSASAAARLTTVIVAPPAQTPPVLPSPNGSVFLEGRGRLQASPDGRVIVGVNMLANDTRAVFVYDAASATVLRSRTVTNLSAVLSVSPDNSRFMAGITLFDTESLAALAQQNASNAPFPFPAGAAGNFNLQQNQGGSVFAPDGSRLYSAFNMAPVTTPPARANVSRLLVSDPDHLLIQTGFQLPENLTGKMVVNSAGDTLYALSESGFLKLSMADAARSPIGMPDTSAVLLLNDQCGATRPADSAAVPIRNLGAGRMTVTAALAGSSGPAGRPGTTPTPGAAGSAQNAPVARTVIGRDGSVELTLAFNPAAARALGTVTPHDFVLQSSEAINILPTVRVYQNFRNTEARGSVFPVPTGVNSDGLTDLAIDHTRQRLYIANPGLNRVEVFDTRAGAFLQPIKVGQLPRSLALGADGLTLYVANTGGEHISVVDLDQNRVTGSIKFPPLPFNAAFTLVTPLAIASSQRGPQILMSDGTLWKVVGDSVQPRALNPAIFGSARTIPGPVRTMASTPDGDRVLLLSGTGTAYLYDAASDEFVSARQVVPTPVTGYFGPIAAGPRGRYYVVNGIVLNESLTPGAPAASTRPVAAVAAAGDRNYVRFTTAPRQSQTQLPADPGLVELVETAAGRAVASIAALEAPLATAAGAQRTNVEGRTIAVNASSTTAYVLTASGLSVLPLGAGRPTAEAPSINRDGVVNSAAYLPQLAPGSLFTIFGRNLGEPEIAASDPLPGILGGACVTLGNTAVPLFMTSEGQINGQIPPNLAAGRYSLLVRSIGRQTTSAPAGINVERYAPAVFVGDNGRPAILHEDGRFVDRDHPATRDQRLVIYATGLGATTGGPVSAGRPSPSAPLAVTQEVQVFIGEPGYRESEMIVEWSGLAPGIIGVYQINIRVPGDRRRGPALPVQIRIGGVDSPLTGPAVPYIPVV